VVYVLLVVLLIGVLGAYFAGIKKGEKWGMPVVVVCGVGALVVLGMHLFGGGSAGGPTIEAGAESERARMVAKGLTLSLPSGARILLVDTCLLPQDLASQRKAAWAKSMGETLTGGADIVAYESLDEPGYVGEAIRRAGGDIDAVIFAEGLPVSHAAAVQLRGMVGEKTVAGYAGGSPDMQVVSQLLQDGLLQAVVVEQEGQLKLYTPDDLP